MSSFSLCVVFAVLGACVQCYVVREKPNVSFVDSADPSKSWTLEKDIGLLDEENEAVLPTPSTFSTVHHTVETVDRNALTVPCPKGTKETSQGCVPEGDDKYAPDFNDETDETEATADRNGIALGFANCPEGYRKAGSACLPRDDALEEEPKAAVQEVIKTGINMCPFGYRKAGPACVPDDNDNAPDEDEN